MTSANFTAQVTAENEETVSYYIQNLFLGEAVSIDNITINGMPGDNPNSQVGSFLNNGGYLPLSSGVVLSTGAVSGEDFGGTSVIFGESTTINVENPFSGDVDLTALSGESVNDVVSIEFDFVPAFEFLVYDYSFGSEEYPEYVNSFNDAFGFFLSGPGIEGPYSAPSEFPMGSINAAIIPGSSTAVTINNVNNGNFFCPGPSPGPCMNCEFYVDNCSIEEAALDGMTTQLMVLETLLPGETYHIKLVLGDALDSAFDTAVILKEGSFRTMAQPPDPTSISEVLIEEMNLAVNPVSDYLQINDLPDYIVSYSLRDMQGRMAIESTRINDSRVIRDVRSLESGLYLLILSDEEGNIWTQRLVKE